MATLHHRQTWKLKLTRPLTERYADGELLSAALDRELHPEGRVRVRVAATASKNKPGFVLDPFVEKSIEEYIAFQAYIKQVVGEKLLHDRAECGSKRETGEALIWDEVTVESVGFEQKNVWTVESLANMKRLMPRINVDQLRTAGDSPDSQSRFELLLRVAWDTEHERAATFRDGRFVSMSLR